MVDSAGTGGPILDVGRTGPLDDGRLDAATAELARRGELRLLVSVVERWAAVGTPTPGARVAQIEALLDLCAMDRAWTRLQALPADVARLPEVRRLTVRMFLDRGWHERAQDAIAEAREAGDDDPELDRLATRAALAAPLPPLEVPAASAPPAAQLAAAEAFLRAGAYLKARHALETLDRVRPGDRRVAELLWALQGDYELVGTTLTAIAARYGGDVELPAEPTNEVPLARQDASAFADDGEDTQAMRLADLAELYDEDDVPEDTQVLRVVGDTGDPATTGGFSDGPTEAAEEEEDDVVVLVQRGARPPPRTARPLPSPRPIPRPTRADTVPPFVMEEELEEVEEVDADELDAEPIEEAPEAAPSGMSRTSLYLLAGGAALLGLSGLGLIAAILLTR